MNSILTFTHLLNGLLMVGIPVLLGVFLTRKFRIGWRLWWIGAATFVLSQIGHIPFNIVVGLLFERGILPTPAINQIVFAAIFGGLSAGVWEETFRYGTLRWWAKDARSWSKSLVLGSGWGGLEAIILGLLVLVNYGVMVAVRFGDLTSLLPEDQAAALSQQMAAYWSLPWPMTLLGALERVFAITMQIALTVIVLQVFTRKNIAWLFLAIGWHALVDALAVYFVSTSSFYFTEAVIGVTAIISLIFIFVLRQPDPPTPDADPSPPPQDIDLAKITPAEPSLEKMDESKYQ